MTTTQAPTNEVRLVGRVSGEPTARELPSGDQLVQLRVVVDRPPRRGDGGRRQVDTIDVACWSARTRVSAQRLSEGHVVEVEGSLRRRFFATGAGRASRYEVEATRLRRARGSVKKTGV
ncbi:single-stranded DNA-binding protein [Ornithinimicrobium sp. Y1847]|uniref:single-stranded DNA-binding protein n=1 Tax=Ornithinimicrobium sp. Y1847 TaxID=3405419 RepID=UPI003B67C483